MLLFKVYFIFSKAAILSSMLGCVENRSLRFLSFPTDFVFDLFKIPKKVQHMIEPYWSYVGEPTSTLNPFMMGMMDYCYIIDGAGLPSKFSHEFSLSLDKVIRKNGGKIFYNSEVKQILVKNRKKK